jgi:hypothetical protein
MSYSSEIAKVNLADWNLNIMPPPETKIAADLSLPTLESCCGHTALMASEIIYQDSTSYEDAYEELMLRGRIVA